MGDLTVFFFLTLMNFIIKNTKDKLPGTSTGLMHKETHEVTFDIDRTQMTSCIVLLQVLYTKGHMKQPSTLTRK